jgi:hypothetical protein
LEQMTLHIPEILLQQVAGDELVDIRCGIADFVVEDGVMQARSLVLDTDVVKVSGTGSTDLAKETLKPDPRSPAEETKLFALRGAITVHGQLGAPEVSVDTSRTAARGLAALALAAINPALALLPLADSGSGKDSDCVALTRQTQAPWRSTAVTQKPKSARPADAGRCRARTAGRSAPDSAAAAIVALRLGREWQAAQRIRMRSVQPALALRFVGRIWRRRWIPTFPSRFAPTGDAFIEVDRAIHSHDLRGAVRAALIDLHSDEGAPAAHGLRVVVRVFLRYPRVGQAPIKPPAIAPAPAPLSIATSGPAATIGPIPGIDSAMRLAAKPAAPPTTPPVRAQFAVCASSLASPACGTIVARDIARDDSDVTRHVTVVREIPHDPPGGAIRVERTYDGLDHGNILLALGIETARNIRWASACCLHWGGVAAVTIGPRPRLLRPVRTAGGGPVGLNQDCEPTPAIPRETRSTAVSPST